MPAVLVCRPHSPRVSLSAIVAACLVVVAACGDDDDDAGAAAVPVTTAPVASAGPAASTASSAAPPLDTTGDDGGTATTATGATTPTPTEEVTALTVQLQASPSGPMAFLYWAEREGLYEAAGLDIELVPGQSSQGTVEAVAQGNADIGLASGVAVLLGVANGQEIRSVGHFFGASTFGLFTPGENMDPAQMAGAVEGGDVLTIAGGPQNVLFDEFLAAYGVDTANVEKTNVPITSLIQLYASGEGDGLITVVPYANALVQGERPSSSVLFRDVTGVEPPDTAVVVGNDLLDEKPDALRRFLEVSLAALAEMRADPEGTVAALVEAEPALTTEVALGQLNGQLPYLCPASAAGGRLGVTSERQWADTVEVFTASGLITGVAVDDVFTDELMTTDPPIESEPC